jgi:hypothetical protein
VSAGNFKICLSFYSQRRLVNLLYLRLSPMNPVQETVKWVYNSFLGALAKLRKATISFVLSVYPSVFLSASNCCHWKDFHEIWYLSIYWKCIEKIRFIESDKNNGYCTWQAVRICYHISLSCSQNEKCCRQICKSCRENQIYINGNRTTISLGTDHDGSDTAG